MNSKFSQAGHRKADKKEIDKLLEPVGMMKEQH